MTYREVENVSKTRNKIEAIGTLETVEEIIELLKLPIIIKTGYLCNLNGKC